MPRDSGFETLAVPGATIETSALAASGASNSTNCWFKARWSAGFYRFEPQKYPTQASVLSKGDLISGSMPVWG